jgi:amylosucrase
MLEPHQFASQAKLSYQRLLPRLTERFAARTTPEDWEAFSQRLAQNFPTLFEVLIQLYGQHYDFFYHLENTLSTLAESWLERSTDLKTLDAQREANPTWFQANDMVGGVCYVDLFAGDLQGLKTKIPYFKELGLTYLHLMPLFKCPEGNSDGGYAVSSYREVNPALGTMADLRELASELRQNGISLVLDFIFNHTSNEHDWAKLAVAGDVEYQHYYLMYPNREMPDAYEMSLREIFPDEHPGAFSYEPTIERWVWTTFHTFQWDLNYANPALFTAMAGEMLAIANLGTEVLRLDAVAFIWKQLGTVCENLPEAHLLIQAFNILARIAAPSLAFKSEAIVHPDEVIKYIRPDECQLSYNPLLMALLWNSLATRETRLLSQAIQHRFAIDPRCAWVNYVRVHDDIGWTFSDEDAAQLGMKANDHRRFLNNFYTDRFPGSFAKGLPFQENPKTGDCRISGTCASLAGLEKALEDGNAEEIELAIRRILLIYGVIMTIGGLPLIYLGDEIGMLNDYGYRDDPAKADDSRWVHRPQADWTAYAQRNQTTTLQGHIYAGFQQLIGLRKQLPALADGTTQIIETGNEHLFGYWRLDADQRALILANFSESEQVCRLPGPLPTQQLAGQAAQANGALTLKPYDFVLLA